MAFLRMASGSGAVRPALKMQKPRIAAGLYHMVPLVGFELTTYRLQGGCSTN